MNTGPYTSASRLTREQARALDRELLELFVTRCGPVALPELFGQSWAPAWAIDAAERLVLAGLIWDRGDDRYEIVRKRILGA